MMSMKIEKISTFDLDYVFKVEFFLNFKEFIEFPLIFGLRGRFDLFGQEEIFGLFMLQNTASAEEFVVIV